MRMLELDFRAENRQAKRAGTALLAAAIAAAIAAGAQFNQLGEESAQAQAAMQQSAVSARRHTVAPRRGGELQPVAAEMKRAGEVALQLKLPWNDLFTSVEAAATPDVALLAIESDPGKRQVKIAGEAKDLESMLDYLRFLGAQPKLANVYLQSHQLQRQDPQQPVRFVLGADWVSAQP